MIKRLITNVYILAAILLGEALWAAEYPHGGQFIIQLGKDHHGEIVIHEREINIYLLDKNMAELSPQGRTGTLSVSRDGSSYYNYPLTQTESFLKANVGSANADKLSGTVTLAINGESYISQFEWHKHLHSPTEPKLPPNPKKNKR